MDNYYTKYLKYKSKYLNLQNQLKLQKGGSPEAKALGEKCIGLEDALKNKIDNIDLSEWDLITETIDSYGFNIVKKDLNPDSENILVMMAGLSNRSFCASLKAIVDKLGLIESKFKAVYFIDLNSFKNEQTDACNVRDAVAKDLQIALPKGKSELGDNFDKLFESEILLNKKLASVINSLIVDKLKLTHVHLLGKCGGAGIAINTVSLSDSYDALYLAVPGNPDSLKPLFGIDTERLNKMKVIATWNDNDDFAFKWGISRDEKATYDSDLGGLKAKAPEFTFETIIYDGGNGHEINPKIFELI